jgi:hypothetical protein
MPSVPIAIGTDGISVYCWFAHKNFVCLLMFMPFKKINSL